MSCEQARGIILNVTRALDNKLFLKKQYFRIGMKEGTSVEKHLPSGVNGQASIQF